MLEKNTIKKLLYTEKPVAILQYIRNGVAYYKATLNDETIVDFEIPCNDMGEADFLPYMEGQLLNRWIV